MVAPSLYNLKNQGKKQGKTKEFCGENPCFWKKDGDFEKVVVFF